MSLKTPKSPLPGSQVEVSILKSIHVKLNLDHLLIGQIA